MKWVIALLAFAFLLAGPSLHADDGADAISAGGIVVMGREPRITMAKEVLQISLGKVVVNYDFYNASSHSITTGIAFPIPDYSINLGEIDPEWQGFEDFRLWVNGSPVAYTIQARAMVKGQDLTPLLTALHIDVASFGHATLNDGSPEIGKLTNAQRERLQEAGLIDHDGVPLWTVQKKYYWTQSFPAHGTVHIRHQYTPVVGSLNSIRYGMGSDPDPESVKELGTFCLDPRLSSILEGVVRNEKEDAWYSYVDFILKTANTWKTPIGEFTLIVTRPQLKGDFADYVSFCWHGPVKKIDNDHFSVREKNFVPTHDLRIGFFHVAKNPMLP